MESVLVANRGEIAVRVMRTCRRLGLRTVAIHTDLDADAPHVRAADAAVRVESYLDVDAVVGAVIASGADAVHPGYGFLSERAALPRALAAAGITFVGPTAEVMDAMGRKDAAREIAVAAGVPVVPSYPTGVSTGSTTGGSTSAGSTSGGSTSGGSTSGGSTSGVGEMVFPVLVKAAAGGGGKGMRVVRSAAELAEATAAARREALHAFGDDTMLVERYVERGRHIEVQVFGDSHGTVLHLGERDCSVQRRHQKVLEEAPAPTISDAVRELVTGSAVALARQVGYTGAGTVEFLLDEATDEAYFLEMNTRLQVEHPVTEAVTGLDLVELQLRVAAGEPLGLTQADVTTSGHAIEARVYAEDSFGGFLPQAGTTSIVRWPTGAPSRSPVQVRVDQALEAGQVVSTAYDPMLGKVVVHGPDRESARLGLVAALERTAILGLTTNVGFLRALAESDAFRDATIDTAWLDRTELAPPDPEVPRLFVAWVQAMLDAMGPAHPFQSDGFRLGAPPAPQLVELDVPVVVDRAAGRVGDHDVRVVRAENHTLEVVLDGRPEQAVVNVQPGPVNGIAEVSHRGQRFVFARPDRLAETVAVTDGTVTAPMPGTVLEVRVSDGQVVAEGEVLGVIEAMKMELSLKAPFAGTVTTAGVTAGAQVALGAALFTVEPGVVEPVVVEPAVEPGA